MRSKLVAVAFGAAFAISLLGATSAAAATEVGNRCAASNSAGSSAAVSLANAPGSPLPAVIPDAGVITRWSFSLGFPGDPEGALTETLKVFRPTGLPQQLQVVGESAPEVVSNGTRTFPTRIPVKAGDLIGALAELGGETGSVFCKTDVPGDTLGFVPGTAPAGSTSAITKEEDGFQNPIVVFVEPDADNDGFGDETQDQCPQNAAVQAPCPIAPVISLSTSASVRKTLATVLVTSSPQASVTVAGTVNLGKGKTVKLNGGTQIVAPGTFSKFTVLFPQRLKAKLKQLSRKRFLWLRLASTAPNVAGAPTVSNLKVKLKGQAKPKPKPKKPRRQAKS
jgi:hypothetical protein